MGQDVSLEAFRGYLSGVKSPHTVKKYVPCVKHFLLVMQEKGFSTFSALPSGFLSEYISILTQEGKNASTARVYVFAVKQYLDWVRDKGIKVTPQSTRNLPKKKRTMQGVLPTNRFSEFFQIVDMDVEEPVRTAAMLLPCSGLRASEMVNLSLADIQSANVKMRSKSKKPKYKKTLVLRVRGKGGKERHVPLMEEGVEVLTGYLAGWRKRFPGPWLFPHRSKNKQKHCKKPITDKVLRSAVQDVRERMGIHFTPHTMRRTYITMLHRKGIDLATIAEIAGHANVQTTIDHYINMEPAHTLSKFHEAGNSLTEE